MNKVEMELQQYGRVLVPNDKIRQRNDVGPGSKTLDELDTFVILSLYHDEPSRSLRSYASWLHYFVGTVVSDTPSVDSSKMPSHLVLVYTVPTSFHMINSNPTTA